MLTMIRNDLSRTDTFGDLLSQASGEVNSFDQLSCSFHPGFKLQVLCPDENIHPSLLCIKCMIDPEIEKRIKIDSVVAIQDIINKITTLNEMEAHGQVDRDALKKMICEFTSKDHLGAFDLHVDAQMKKLHKEIERTKDSLDQMEAQFKKVFEKQQKQLRGREEELKKRINGYIADQEQLKQFLNLTPQQLMEKIRKIGTVKEYEKFIKTLYQRESLEQQTMQSTMIKGILEVMDDVRDKVDKMKSYKIQTSLLEEMRQKLESMEIIDQSFQAVEGLDCQLMPTLEKVREAAMESKKVVGALKERIANFTKKSSSKEKKANNQMEVEVTLSTELNGKADHSGESKAVNGQHAKSTAEKLPSAENNEVNGLTTAHHHNDVDAIAVEEDQIHRRQKIDAESYRRIEIKRTERVEIIVEDDEGPAEQRAQEEAQPVEKQNHTMVGQEEIVSNAGNYHKINSGIFNSAESLKENAIDLENEQVDQGLGSQPPQQRLNGASMKEDQKEVHEENNEGLKINEELMSLELDNSSHEGDFVELESNVPVRSLHDWIDQKLDGYIVFMNTMQEQERNSQNSILRDKWKSLEKTEKDEYWNVAQKARSELKSEYQDIEEENTELSEIQKIVEGKIRVIRKE